MGLTVLPIEVRDRLAGADLNYREAGATAGNLPTLWAQSARESRMTGMARSVFCSYPA